MREAYLNNNDIRASDVRRVAMDETEKYRIKKKSLLRWAGIKYNIHSLRRKRTMHSGELWWVICGENIGSEINGKGDMYLRPVLIYRKLSQAVFMGIPLSAQLWHQGEWFVHFKFHNKEQIAVLSQARVYSMSRLHRRIGALHKGDMHKIHVGFHKLYSGVDLDNMEQNTSK